MSIKIKAGEVYKCPDLRRGESGKGEWAFFKLNAQKGFDCINVWASNPGEIKGAQAVRVVRIDTVELRARLDERSQKWYKDYNVTATLEKAAANGGDDFMPANLDELNSIFGI